MSKLEIETALAGLFEQLLIFDRIVISTNRLSFGLVFLLARLGINTVERLIDSGYLQFMIWSPVVVSGSGKQLEDGTVDDSVIYGQPPIAAGSLSDQDSDPDHNIKSALSHFNFHSDRKKSFLKKARKAYIVPDGMQFASSSAKLIIDSYRNNNLASLGLPFEKEPEQLDLEQRFLLLSLSHKVIETAVLAKYGLKSYENFEHIEICKQNLRNIGKAYNIADNTDTILNLRNLPNLKTLYLQNQADFETVFKIRHYSNAKYFRKWINEVGENADAEEITREFFKEINGNHKFFNTREGKFIRNMSMLGIGAGLEKVITGSFGAVGSATLGLLDTFWLDSVLIGRNPSMFVEDLRAEIEKREEVAQT